MIDADFPEQKLLVIEQLTVELNLHMNSLNLGENERLNAPSLANLSRIIFAMLTKNVSPLNLSDYFSHTNLQLDMSLKTISHRQTH